MARSHSEIEKFVLSPEGREFWREVEAFSSSSAQITRKVTWVCERFCDRPIPERANGIAQVLRRREAIHEACKILGVAPLSIALVDERPGKMARFLDLNEVSVLLCQYSYEGGLDFPSVVSQ